MNANTQILERESWVGDISQIDLLELPGLMRLPNDEKPKNEKAFQDLQKQEEEDTLFLFDYF